MNELNQKRVNLALQGGGAHGAFTWGVLDRLLEDGRIGFDGVSGTSAGAMNAAALAQGMMEGGRDGARAALEKLWVAVTRAAPFDLSGGKDLTGGGQAMGIRLMLYVMRQFSPHQINPFNFNPLRTILEDQIDVERLRRENPLKLFIAATNANTGRLRIFGNDELSVDALLASGCLPVVHRTIEIDGEPYWDGAYSANPAIYPLIYECDAKDVMLVLLSPMLHGKTPKSAEEIHSRTMDIAFNSTFLREMRSVAYLRDRLVSGDHTQIWKDEETGADAMGSVGERLLNMRFHMITDDELMSTLSGESRLATNPTFIEKMRDRGREHASEWLERNFHEIGRRSSVDLKDTFF